MSTHRAAPKASATENDGNNRRPRPLCTTGKAGAAVTAWRGQRAAAFGPSPPRRVA